jgi:uncharacterized protein YbjQ (UPF0145 family)
MLITTTPNIEGKRIKEYLDTLRKQGANLFHALTHTFQGHVPQPRLA